MKMGPLRGNVEQRRTAHFGRTYVGRRFGAVRDHPLFRIDTRGVRNRMAGGGAQANNSAEAIREGPPSGVDAGRRQPVWAFVESVRS